MFSVLDKDGNFKFGIIRVNQKNNKNIEYKIKDKSNESLTLTAKEFCDILGYLFEDYNRYDR